MHKGIIKLAVIGILVICASLVAVSMMVSNSGTADFDAEGVLTFTAFRGEFVSSVNEAGEIGSSRNVEIRCTVKSRGSGGTAIIEIVPEGTQVDTGDFICQLDDSVLREELTEKKIQVANDEASVIQADSDLDTARRTLKEFENGIYEQELAALAAERVFAEETLRRSKQNLKYSSEMTSKGYSTKTQLEADTFATEKAVLELNLAKLNFEVYEKFTRERMLAEYSAEIKKAEANVKAATYTLELSELKLKENEQQTAACRITAPSAGMVVYASENDRDDSFVIEEGAVLRDAQPIVRLPDPEAMQVTTMVNDSQINSIAEGLPALVRVDTDPESPVAGVVRRVSSFPEPRRWFQAPIEYEVFVDITEESPLIRNGLRGKVEIFVERIPGVIQVPMSSVIRHNDSYFVILKSAAGTLKPVQVEIGSNNDKFIIIEDGVQPNDEIVIDGDSFADDIQFPDSSSTSP